MRKKVLITGGAGFIGSHLAEALITQGHSVYIIDNESTGLLENVPNGVIYHKGDVRKVETLDVVFQEKLDTVFHIAGQASTIQSFANPLDDLNINVHGTVNIVQKCLEYGVPRMLYASSMTSYGLVDSKPTTEAWPCRPYSYYGITKYAAERYVHVTHERNDLKRPFNVTSFRMFNVYGERQRLDNPYQGVMGIFIGNILRNEPIIIHGDGSQSRDFIHINDVVSAWLQAWENPNSFGKVMNLGTGKNRSIMQLVDAILAACGKERAQYPITYEPRRPGDQEHTIAGIQLIQDTLNWSPQIPFSEGVRRTVDWAISTANIT